MQLRQVVSDFGKKSCVSTGVRKSRHDMTEAVNPFPSLCFTRQQYKSFENTVGEREIAGENTFSFSHSVFYPFGELHAIFIKFKIVVCKLLQFRRV